ncbi:MAG: glycosyltransferase [Gemmatimonadaceae bacterium]
MFHAYLSRVSLLQHRSSVVAIVAALPWIITPLVVIARMAQSCTLNEESPELPADAPRTTVIIPARNEAHNIALCLRSVLLSPYAPLGVIVVDDHSTDATARIAREIAASDPRVHVLTNPDLPPDWFGKQWACCNGAQAATGDILIFVDADTRIAPDLITRSVNGMLRTAADLYSVIGRQEMHTFWERMIQPQIFNMLGTRYGGTELVNRSPHAYDKIANGQYLMIRRSAYEAMGGHAIVRTYVAEDLMLAQTFFAAGRKTVVVLGWDQLATRMYTSLRDLVSGWRKNVYAGGRHAVPGGRVGQLLFPVMLPMPALMELVPLAVLLAGAFGLIPAAVTLWSGIVTAALLLWWIFVYVVNGEKVWYALLFPVGAAALLYILISATASGSNVAWKGRQYTSEDPGMP